MKDIQKQTDERKLPINQVGVKNLKYPIRVRDRTRGAQETVATVQLTVDLPHHFKGTHMSRFLEVLHANGPLIHVENIRTILDTLITRLESECAHADFTFPYFIEKTAPTSGAKGFVDYEVSFSASIERTKRDFVLRVVVPVTTLCPCSQAISQYGAHNQRGMVTLAIRFSRTVWIEDLIALVESCASCEIYSLLKRTDEKTVTERAYNNPVFVEDLVRTISQKCRTHPDITWHRVEAENFESIHNHNAYACIESPL